MKTNNRKLTMTAGVAATATLISASVFAWGGYSTPNVFGGQNFYSGTGGFIGSSQRNVFGGQNFYSGTGGFVGSSQPNVFGGMNYNFRGKDGESTLFADKIFNQKIEVEKIATSLENRDVDTLTSCAWDLKGLETILGKKDKKTNSGTLFAAAAQMAVEQGNVDGLKAIIALAPECKKYQDALAIKGKTRGAGYKPLCALPQVVQVGAEDWKTELKKLTAWQTPMLDAVNVCGSFRGISKADAELCSTMINGGRVAMCPLAMATGAVQLSAYESSDVCCEKMKPASIFKEAVELAVFRGDWNAVKQLSGFYATTNFCEPEYGKYLKEIVSMGGGTRGQSADDLSGDSPLTELMKQLTDK